jgi:hypothetical protein
MPFVIFRAKDLAVFIRNYATYSKTMFTGMHYHVFYYISLDIMRYGVVATQGLWSNDYANQPMSTYIYIFRERKREKERERSCSNVLRHERKRDYRLTPPVPSPTNWPQRINAT